MKSLKMYFRLIMIGLFCSLLAACNNTSEYQNSRKILDSKKDNYYEIIDISQNSMEDGFQDCVAEVYGNNIYHSMDGHTLMRIDKEGENEKEIFTLQSQEESIIDIYCVAEDDIFLMVQILEEMHMKYRLLEMDENGKVSSEIALNLADDFYPADFIIDDKKDIYICSTDNSIEKYDIKGDLAYRVELETMEFGICKNSKNDIIVGQAVNDIFSLSYMDKETGDLEQQMQISVCENGNGVRVFPGMDYECCFYDDNYLYGFVGDKKLAEPVLSWTDIGIDRNEIGKAAQFSDGSIFTVLHNMEDNVVSFEKLILSDNDADKEDIVLVGVNIDSGMREKVLSFNKESEQYHILVKDYAGEEDPYGALNLDIVSGMEFDIISLQGMSADEYIAKGMLEDLSGYINKDEYVDAYIQAVSQDGAIYQMSPVFSIHTMLGKAGEVGEEAGWNFEEYKKFVEKNKNKEIVNLALKEDLLRQACEMQMDDFINWEEGTVNFETEEFIQLLEFVNSYSVEGNSEISYFDKLRKGDTLLAEVYMMSGNDYRTYKCVYGEEISAKGYPVDDRNGNFMSLVLPIGIYNKSKNKQASWEFISMFLTDEAEYAYKECGFPTRKDTLARLFENWKGTGEEDSELTVYVAGKEEYADALNNRDVEKLNALIASSNQLLKDNSEIVQIINEETQAYFNGQVTVKRAAECIQNRVNTYVNEHM